MRQLMASMTIFMCIALGNWAFAGDPCYPITYAKIIQAKNGAFLEINFEKTSGSYGNQMVNIKSVGVTIGPYSKVCFQPNKTMIAPRSYYINVPTQTTYDIWKNKLMTAVKEYHEHSDVLPTR